MSLLLKPEPGESCLIRAGFLFPVSGPPIRDGLLLFRDGHILEVAPASEGVSLKADRVFEFPDASLIPGLVNAHAHLELSYFRGLQSPSRDFTEWIAGLRAKQTWGNREFELSTRAGRRECIRGGCTTIGDILSVEGETGAKAAHQSCEQPLRVRAYQEFLGWGPRGLEAARARRPLEEGPDFFPAYSAHAPYSTHRDLYEFCLDRGLPFSTHGAETCFEEEYMLEGSGPFAEFQKRLGWKSVGRPWDPEEPRSLAAWLAERPGDSALQFVHGTWLREEDDAALLKAGATVVYCPGSVAWFHEGKDPHPLRRLLDGGIPVALGTDSLASSPSLNMPETCTLAYRAHPDLEPEEILHMATLAGARSLDFRDCGVLAPGSPADFLLMESPGLRPKRPREAIEEALLSGYRVPNLHAFQGQVHAFAELAPLQA
ncbi:MAG: amidohydrolase family protein [Candidatus Krumholzibacteria bacterium]|jgi:cytosine/adenosine deaminase-related metal-dependent hydrolase|nr:amidohydrolase family protein [Candidatus Krumholzibacteria bacterium]MDP7021823.1 amidohydrolase family protein [Candidatus Krumholzibacteria bacterium]